jgi:hypothetical protein
VETVCCRVSWESPLQWLAGLWWIRTSTSSLQVSFTPETHEQAPYAINLSWWSELRSCYWTLLTGPWGLDCVFKSGCLTGIKIASTATIEHDLNPKWNEEFVFQVCHDNVAHLHFGALVLLFIFLPQYARKQKLAVTYKCLVYPSYEVRSTLVL